MRFSPAHGIAQAFSPLLRMGKKYGAEWWILVIGALIILAIAFMAIFAENIAPFSPYDQETGPQLAPPSGKHLMGTDNLQRDVWSRMVHGSRNILRIAVLAALISSVFGITLGLISGFFGGYLDRVLSLIMDSVYSFPGLILAIALSLLIMTLWARVTQEFHPIETQGVTEKIPEPTPPPIPPVEQEEEILVSAVSYDREIVFNLLSARLIRLIS